MVQVCKPAFLFHRLVLDVGQSQSKQLRLTWKSICTWIKGYYWRNYTKERKNTERTDDNCLLKQNLLTVDVFSYSKSERGYTGEANTKWIWNRYTSKYAAQLGLPLCTFSLLHLSFDFWKSSANFHRKQ